MSELEHRKRNRRLGIILCLLFAGLFVIVTTAIITGSKASQSVESVVRGLVVPILGVIGLLLIIAAVVEIVLRIMRNRVRE
jgi:succinate dehydrogenase/fumarate reductase cytochrome b subunit